MACAVTMPGCDRVGHERQRYALAAARDPRADRAQRDRARDAEAAVPDLQRVDRVLARPEVAPPVRAHVVEPAADQPERHGPHGDVDHGPVRAATRHEPPLTPPDGDDDAGDDAQCVRPDRHRSEMPDPLRRARDVGRYRPSGKPHALTVTVGCERPVNAPTGEVHGHLERLDQRQHTVVRPSDLAVLVAVQFVADTRDGTGRRIDEKQERDAGFGIHLAFQRAIVGSRRW